MPSLWFAVVSYVSCRWCGVLLQRGLLLAVAVWTVPVFAWADTVPGTLPSPDGGKTSPRLESSAVGTEKSLNAQHTDWRCGVRPAQQADILPDYAVEDMAPPSDIDALHITLRARSDPELSSDDVWSATFRLADIAIVPGQETAALAYLRQHYRDIASVIPLPMGPMDGRGRMGADDADALGRDPRQPAYFLLRDGSVLQQHLVWQGLAMVAPGMDADQPVGFYTDDRPDNETHMAQPLRSLPPSRLRLQAERKTVSRQAVITALVVTEENARLAQRGIWRREGQYRRGQAGNVTPAHFYFVALKGNDPRGEAPFAADGIGSFAVVEGRLRSVEIQKYRAYLNFGKDWRKDFTIALDQDQMAAIAASGFGLAGWVGQRILVRGMIENRGGPYIAPLNLVSLCVAKQ